MKNLLLLALLCTLTACATYPAGEDEYGQQLQATGEEVLHAVRNYMDDTSRVPRSLQDLVPKYLKALPADPKIIYDTKTSTLGFQYVQKGPNGMLVLCQAPVGQTEWVCS